MVEFHSMWQLAAGDDDRQGARAVRHVLARRPDQDGQPRPVSKRYAEASHGADLRLGDAGDRAGRSAICWKPAPPASSCSTCPGAAAFRRPARSPRWPRPGICRSRRTIAPARWCLPPPPIFRSTRRTRWFRKACAPITAPGIATSSPALPEVSDGLITVAARPGLGLELASGSRPAVHRRDPHDGARRLVAGARPQSENTGRRRS